MKAPGIMLATVMAAGQALSTADMVMAMPLGGAAGSAAVDPLPFVLRVQGAERLERLWQHRSLIEQALQAPPEALTETPPPLPTARPLQAPLPEPELSASPEEPLAATPGEPETAAVQRQLAEASDDVLSCEEAAAIVTDYGFSAVRPLACSGDIYKFSATRDGTAYSVGIAAAAGEITEVSRE